MNVVLIGTGNTATVLGVKLKAAGHTLLQVFGRRIKAAEALSNLLQSEAIENLDQINTQADVYIIAVSDNAIEEIALQLQLPKKAVVVHTAAAVSINVLKNLSTLYGVFYPLQTLKKGSASLPEIPILIEANNKQTEDFLTSMALSITQKVVYANGEQRLKLHLAAVLCNNFANHLYALAEQYCTVEGVDFSLLKPLIAETALQLESMPAAAAQTGPAMRHDTATIEKHLDLLSSHPQLKELYTLFTKSIQERC